jgi:hypothetical protein
MKKNLLIFLIIPFTLFAQIPQNAPWITQENSNLKTTEVTFDQIVKNANSFFETIDVTKKGSGYKPFKRWENHWSSYLQPDGKIAPSSTVWKAWEEKNKMALTSNLNTVQSNWQSIGPFSFTDTGSWSSGQGRVNCVAVDPNNPNIYYAGAPVGGIWKSTNAGISWAPLTDYLPQIGVSGIAIDYRDSNIIYITTGDDDAGDSYFVGVMKSTDGGITWNTTGNLDGTSANEIYIDPYNSNIIWTATNTGLYKSSNAGINWELKRAGNIKDFKLKPGDSNTIYAVSGNTFYHSTDGNIFNVITAGLPTSSSRLSIDVTPANPNLVYVLSSDLDRNFQGVYKSMDSGMTFLKTLETDDLFDGSSQSWFDMALGVSNTDANTLFVGVLNVWKSTDGGNNFIRINNWNNDSSLTYTHADIHFLRYFNRNLFAGTDGGIYKSVNDGTSFTSLTTGMAIGQFYKISVAKQSSQKIVGGLQDNGGYAYSNDTWHNYHGADGMDAAVNPQNSNQYFGFIQNGGSLYKTENGGLTSTYVTGAPSGEEGNWVTPLVCDYEGTLYAGFKSLYQIQNNVWQKISTYDFGGNIAQIEIDPINKNTIYVSRLLNLYKSTDAGINFSLLNTPFIGYSISSIEVNNHNSEIMYVTTSGSNGGVYKSNDGGTTWINITGNLTNESKNVVRHQKYNTNNPIYVGTYLGVYYLDDTSTDWQLFSTNLPNAEVTDLEITEIDGIITASTYGRGIWQSAIPQVLSNYDVTLQEILKPHTISCGSVSPIIKIKNTGQNTINQVTVNYNIDNNSYTEIWNGNLSSLASTEIELTTYSLAKGKHSFQVTSTITNDAFSDNNSGSTVFYTNISDDTPHLVNSFESKNDSWLIVTEGRTDNSDLWVMAAPQAGSVLLNTVSSGNNAYITNPAGKYSDNTVSDLYTPCMDLTKIQNPVMKFKMAFDIELDWDVLYVQYSTDNGLSWNVLGTADDPNWYNNTYSEHDLTIGGQWSGTDAVLKEYSYDLTAFTNEPQIIFKFHFASDQLENGEGALIDDFVISGTLANEDLQYQNLVTLFPNPTENNFSVKWPHAENAVLQMVDLTGKKIIEKSINADSTQNFEIPNLSKGLYIIYFQTNDKYFSKKLIIK